MSVRIPVIAIGLVAALPAKAGELKYDEAKHLIAGKLYSYSCFDGTTGAGRIQPDGSVVGTIRIKGSGPLRFVSLPAGTLHNRGGSVCATVKGLPMSPCFKLVQTSGDSFRGSIFGLSFAYCDFIGRGSRVKFARAAGSRQREATATTQSRD